MVQAFPLFFRLISVDYSAAFAGWKTSLKLYEYSTIRKHWWKLTPCLQRDAKP